MSDRINRSVPIHEISTDALPADLRAIGARAFRMGGCAIIVTREPAGWHLSISRNDRDPTWAEIVTARYRLLPDAPEMVIPLPTLSEYVNLHPYCFHLYEAPVSLIARLP